MALRLGEHVVCGELLNTRKNCVHGYLGLRGMQRPVLLQFVGNCAPDLAGRHIRFEVREPAPDEDDSLFDSDESEKQKLERMNLKGLAWQQVGPVGNITAAKKVRVADCPPGELYRRWKLGEPPPMTWKRCLYLEWHSQNGRVVVELVDPVIEFVEPEQKRNVSGDPSTPLAAPEDDGHDFPDDSPEMTADASEDEDEDETRRAIPFHDGAEDELDTADDPYDLIPGDLQRALDAQARETDRALGGEAAEASETIRELELMDNLIESGAGEPLDTLFDEPVRLPRPDQLDDQQAEEALKMLLARLALHGVALDICEHFTMADAYRLLVERLFPEESAFPQLRGTQWVQHFSTSDFCDACQAEFDR